MPLNPQRYVKMLGRGFVAEYSEMPMLVIGRNQWSRAELSRMGIVQMKACSILSSIAKKLGVTSLQELYETTSPYILADYPCGIVTLFVAFAIFDEHNLDADEWYAAGKRDQAVTTFTSLKKRELQAKAREKADAKKRRKR